MIDRRALARWMAGWAVVCVPAGAATAAGIRLPAVFGDHMVLQQRTEAPVWGWADPGQRIEVEAGWLEKPVSCSADGEGLWETHLPTPEAGGPFAVTIRGTNTVTLDDVLIGEVWICSGQSNMEMPVAHTGPGYRGVLDDQREIAAADYPRMRLFTVERAYAPEPRDDCAGAWRPCSPERVGSFSAVGYYFGRSLHQELDLPVGLICAAWGGTPAEAWTSRSGLDGLPFLAHALAEVDALRADPHAFDDDYEAAMLSWREQSRLLDPGLRERWMREIFDDTGWKTLHVPGVWTGEDLADFDGAVWFRRTIELPKSWAGRNLTLELGPIDDWDQTWFNGLSIGAHDSGVRWQTPRIYPVPGDVVRKGKNTIAVRIIDAGGAGGFRGASDQLKLAPSEGDEPSLPLAGEWRCAIGASGRELPPHPRKKAFHARSPTALYNGMIAPLAPYALRGAIWYQGESNRYDPAAYRTLFPAMIESWRHSWDRGAFPFYYVQIAPFEYRHHGEPPSDATAELREAQLMALRTPNTGMAVTLDVGNPRDIHPRNKKPVGQRLARWALAKTYGRDLVYSGPLYKSMQAEGRRLRLFFDHIGSGLSPVEHELAHFEIAGASGTFVDAHAEIDGDSVVVWSEQVDKPAAARYAWSDAPTASLFNKEGLPASPFQTGRRKR